jgi:hypothetical protein
VRKRVVVVSIVALFAAAIATVVLAFGESSSDRLRGTSAVRASRTSSGHERHRTSASGQSSFVLPQKDVEVLEAGLASSEPAVEAKTLAAAVRTKANLRAHFFFTDGMMV